jgi:hypothetical protein
MSYSAVSSRGDAPMVANNPITQTSCQAPRFHRGKMLIRHEPRLNGAWRTNVARVARP